MSSLAAWAPGVLCPTFTDAFTGTDLNGFVNGNSILSSSAIFDNSVALDQFAIFSLVAQFVSAQTIGAAATVGLYLAILQADAATYGDGRLVVGTAAAYIPQVDPIGGFAFPAGASVTNLFSSMSQPTIIPPTKFRLIAYNNTGFAWKAATTNRITIQTFRQNTNA